MSTQNKSVTVFPSAARTATANSAVQSNYRHRGAVFFVEITAASGTNPTLDLKVQAYDPVGDHYVDVPSASFAQKTGTGTDSLVVYPGVAETANRSVSDVLPHKYRVVATIGGTTPSFTFSVAAQPIL